MCVGPNAPDGDLRGHDLAELALLVMGNLQSAIELVAKLPRANNAQDRIQALIAAAPWAMNRSSC